MSYNLQLKKSFCIAVFALILNALSFTALSQNVGYDIYSAGKYKSSDMNGAAIYKNGEILYSHESTLITSATDLAVFPNDDIYWIFYTREGNKYTIYLSKNDVIIKEIEKSKNISSMYFVGETLYFSGFQRNENGSMDAKVWEGEDMTDYLNFGDGTNNSKISKSTTYGDDVYHCGWITVGSGKKGIVWKNNEILFICSEDKSTYFDDIAIDGDDIYTQGVTFEGHNTQYCIWKNDIKIVDGYYPETPILSITAFDGDLYYSARDTESWMLFKNDEYYCYWPIGDFHNINGLSKITNYEGEPWLCGGTDNIGSIWKGSCDRILQPEGCLYIANFQIVTKEYPELGAEWYYEITDDGGNVTYQYLQCSGDTTINQKDVKIILRTNTLYDKGPHQTVTHEYVYGENGVVYWWNKDLQEFTTLYNFNAEVGDEWEIKVGMESITMHVDEVTTCEYNDEVMKMLIVSDEDDIFSGNIICNMGHTTSYFPEKLMSRRDSDYRVDGIRCYWLDGRLMFSNGETDCEKIYSVEENNSNDNSLFRIFPNPTNGTFVLETENNVSFKITNLIGQTIISGNLEIGTNNIDVSDLNDGIYFIIVGNKTKKLMIKK